MQLVLQREGCWTKSWALFYQICEYSLLCCQIVLIVGFQVFLRLLEFLRLFSEALDKNNDGSIIIEIFHSPISLLYFRLPRAPTNQNSETEEHMLFGHQNMLESNFEKLFYSTPLF
jgi:hypothetical protein